MPNKTPTEPTFVYVVRCAVHSDLLEDCNRRELLEQSLWVEIGDAQAPPCCSRYPSAQK